MLIAMATYSPPNDTHGVRAALMRRSLVSLLRSIRLDDHRVVVVVNGINDATDAALRGVADDIGGRWNATQLAVDGRPVVNAIRFLDNVGTARAINAAWRLGAPGEALCKMDDDVIIHSSTWPDEIEEAIGRRGKIGVIGLKRPDLAEAPWQVGPYHSELVMLPHVAGQTWVVVEEVRHVMGTCQVLSPAAHEKIGYLWQPGLYGFDDSLLSYRSHKAGFKNVFLPHIRIEHIDPGGTDYSNWKRSYAGDRMAEYQRAIAAYNSGERSLYEGADS